jgi:hypothetical protein
MEYLMHKVQNRTNMSRTVIPCIIPEKGDTTPFLIFVAVLAIAPVAGIPLK